MIALINQVLNLDEHLYLLLRIPKLQKLGHERLRLPIQKPYQIHIKAGKRMSTNAKSPVEWREISM